MADTKATITDGGMGPPTAPCQCCPMCGATIECVSRQCRSCGEDLMRLVRRTPLQRGIEVALPDGVFLVEYIGSKIGYEFVRTEPGKTFRKTSVLWFVPRFDFEIGRHPAVIEVRVALWFEITLFSLRVDDVLVYDE